MGATDWTTVAGSLVDTDPGRQVIVTPTRGLAPFAGRAVLAMRSMGSTGCFAQRIAPTAAGFDPIAPGLGGEVSVALRRGTEGAEPFAFVALQGDDVTSTGYLLGLSSSGRIALVKAAPNLGIPDAAPGGAGVLRRSSVHVNLADWAHLRLEVVCSSNGDVVLNVYRSTADSVAAPAWEPVPGIERFIDDALGVASGSLALSGGGRLGLGCRFAQPGAWCAFDRVTAARQ